MTINCKAHRSHSSWDFERDLPFLMVVSIKTNLKSIVGRKMLGDHVTFIDIGAIPVSLRICSEEELNRIILRMQLIQNILETLIP
jgi:hypothetical protein